LFTLKLATVREDGEPTRRRALRSEFTEEEWRLVTELAGDPDRLLVTATPEGGETYAEVAHEAIFRRWDKLREWVAGEREFLAWRSGLEANRRAWDATAAEARADAVLMGLPLTQASNWLSKRAADIPEADQKFIFVSRKAAQRRRRRVQALVGALVALLTLGGVVWWLTTLRRYDKTECRLTTLPSSKLLVSLSFFAFIGIQQPNPFFSMTGATRLTPKARTCPGCRAEPSQGT
jgi:hypothetical protein